MHVLSRCGLALLLASSAAFAQPAPVSPSYTVTALDVTAQPALVTKGNEQLEKLGPAVKVALAKVEAYMKQKNLKASGAAFTRTLIYKQGAIGFEAGFPVATAQKGADDVYSIVLPAGKVAKTIHTGPLDKAPYAYKALHSWMYDNKKKTAGQPWEVYAGKDQLEVVYPFKDKK